MADREAAQAFLIKDRFLMDNLGGRRLCHQVVAEPVRHQVQAQQAQPFRVMWQGPAAAGVVRRLPAVMVVLLPVAGARDQTACLILWAAMVAMAMPAFIIGDV